MNGSDVGIDALFDPDVVQDPHDYYRDLRQNDPVHEVAGTGTFLVTRMDLIHEVVNRTETFSSTSGEFLHKGDWALPGLRPAASGYSMEAAGGAIATADPPDHQRQRKVVARKLSATSMREMEPEFRALVVDALSDIGPDGRFEWMSRVAEPLPMIMVSRILGLPDALAPELKKQGYAMVERISGFVPEDRIQTLEDEGINGLTPVLEAYIHAKDGSTTYADGLIGIVAHAVSEGELTDLEALGILSVLIAAGGESTTSLTGTAVRILAERPDLQTKLRGAPDLVSNFVEEALRYDPPFRGHYRVVARDTELGGKPLPAGSHLVLVWPAANRDPAVYEHADEIRLDRPNPRYHVGFGWGIHLCVGAPLARVEAQVAIETLLARTRRFRIDSDQTPLRYHPSLLVRRLESLPLILEVTAELPRHSSKTRRRVPDDSVS
jgi:cytochrome P450